MDGFIFEIAVNSLLKKMGFQTELTKKSGDGGIDIVAKNNEPIFKGIYLIQCKYWSKPVGEPPIRDLYGVYLSGNANKAILITNSTFTDAALKFAEGKNLELIDGSILTSLFEKYDIHTDKLTLSSETKSRFTENHNFNLDKYNYLLSRLENERLEPLHCKNLQQFFFDHLRLKNFTMMKSGLLSEFINLNDEYIRRFCKKNKMGLVEKEALLYLNSLFINSF